MKPNLALDWTVIKGPKGDLRIVIYEDCWNYLADRNTTFPIFMPAEK